MAQEAGAQSHKARCDGSRVLGGQFALWLMAMPMDTGCLRPRGTANEALGLSRGRGGASSAPLWGADPALLSLLWAPGLPHLGGEVQPWPPNTHDEFQLTQGSPISQSPPLS